MRQLLEKRLVQWVLFGVVALVWGYNMVSIFDLTSEKTPENELSEWEGIPENLAVPEREQYTYSADYRNPFSKEFLLPKKIPAKPVKTVKKPTVPPVLTLLGVIEQTAQVMTKKTNKIHFVAIGDTLEGAIVTAIARDSVHLSFKSKQFSITF